jgi:hypothetical protein
MKTVGKVVVSLNPMVQPWSFEMRGNPFSVAGAPVNTRPENRLF